MSRPKHAAQPRIRLGRPRRNRALLPGLADAGRVQAAVEVQQQAGQVSEDGFLVLTGDKQILFSESGRSFIMFGLRGRACLAIGPAVGDRDETASLERAFIALTRAAGCWPAFYAVDAASAQRLSQSGLDREKVGERAIVDLQTFSLTGKGKKDLRNERNRAARTGCRFEVVPPGQDPAWYEALRPVSQAWLALRGGAEKRFSMGRFDPDYLRHFHLAVVWRNERPVAFANIWMNGSMCTLDLMRFSDDEPGGGMDYLFTEALLWAQARGLATFDLGLAPLAGLDQQAERSTVARLGSLIYAHGGRFYGFEGLRQFKDKFDPRWEPSYICAANDWRIAAAAVGVAALTGGGVRGLLRRTRNSE